MFSWELIPPKPLYIVTGYFPEANPRPNGPVCRPLLVLDVKQNIGPGAKFVCKVAYGTKNTNTPYGTPKDPIIGNLGMLNTLELKYSTRFIMDKRYIVEMEWRQPFFEPWVGKLSPILSDLGQFAKKKIP